MVLYDPEYRGLYDRLLLLDSDAMLYDFSRDISTYFIPIQSTNNFSGRIEDRIDFVFAAHKTNKSDANNTESVNIGVSLWNLSHPLTPLVVDRWKMASISRLRRFKDDDDQGPLQSMLKAMPPEHIQRVIIGVSDELGYGKGTFVKHFIRTDFSTWITKDTETKRIARRLMLNEVCVRYDPVCAS
jgi:hypothetical protein